MKFLSLHMYKNWRKEKQKHNTQKLQDRDQSKTRWRHHFQKKTSIFNTTVTTGAKAYWRDGCHVSVSVRKFYCLLLLQYQDSESVPKSSRSLQPLSITLLINKDFNFFLDTKGQCPQHYHFCSLVWDGRSIFRFENLLLC